MKSKIVWLTGLSGSGKTTLSNYISKKLKKKNFKIKTIDGDTFRKNTKVKKINKNSIIKNNLSIINYIEKLKDNYDYVIISVISPLRKTRALAKKKFQDRYFEVYTKCKLNVLISRDTKKLYKKAKDNIIKDLIGYNSKIVYEKSNYKKIVVNTAEETISISANKILKKII